MGKTRPDITSLRAVSLYHGVPDRQLEELAPHADVIRLAAGEVLAEAGRTVRQLVVVLDGEVDGDTPDGAIGARELVEDRPHQRTVTTVSDSTVVVISAPAFRWSARAIPEVAARLGGAA